MRIRMLVALSLVGAAFVFGPAVASADTSSSENVKTEAWWRYSAPNYPSRWFR